MKTIKNKLLFIILSLCIFPVSITCDDSQAQDLILTQTRLEELHEKYLTDPVLKKYIDHSIKQANRLLFSDPPSLNSDRLWAARYTMELVTQLGFAYRWTEDEKYARKSEQILLAVCAFPDWNPDHFLDAAEMGIAVSLGMDWIKTYLTENNKNIIYRALINKTLSPGARQMNSNAYWTWIDNNWNVICNSGMIISALAVKSYDDHYSKSVLPKAVKNLKIPLKKFEPDGVWYEGMDYMEMIMDMYSYTVASLISSRGDDLGLLDYKGIGHAGEFYISCEGKNERLLSFADIESHSTRRLAPSLFYLGKMFDNPKLITNEQAFIARKNNNEVFHIIWYEPFGDTISSDGSKYYAGENSFAFLNQDVNDNDAIYLGIKAGVNGTSHGHLDIGNFEFDALGERWAVDLGADNYDLPGYFVFEKDNGQRWTYFRTGSLSHNVPIINGDNQRVDGRGFFTDFSFTTENPYLILDISDPYRIYVKSLMRGIKLIDTNRSLIIQDAYSLKTPQECYWGITTEASIEIINDKLAVLRQEGKELYVNIISPSDCSFKIVAAQQDREGYSNAGVYRLLAVKPTNGILDFTITVQLSPNWKGYITPKQKYMSLTEWSK